jgi:hypothetical protein
MDSENPRFSGGSPVNFNRDRRGPAASAVAFSLFLHLLIVLASFWIVLPGSLEPSKEEYRFRVKSINAKAVTVAHPGNVSARQITDEIKTKRGDRAARPLLKDVPMEDLMSASLPRKEAAPQIGVKKTDLEKSAIFNRPDIDNLLIQTDEKILKDRVQIHQKSASTRLSETFQRAGQEGATGESFVQKLQKPLQNLWNMPGNVDVDPEEGMPGFTPSARPGSAGVDPMDERIGESRHMASRYERLDDFLDIAVYTYEDPASREKYYMIKIFAKKEARNLKVIPKEIIFAVDASLSISPDRLNEFKQGIRHCLQNLNPGDLFNIIAFKDKVVFFSPHSIPASPQIIKEAERFVAGLTASERTDVYAAFKGIVETPLSRTPSNVMLISDGRPTYGVVDSREVINSVTRLNMKARPVFAFSGGSKVNRYLLDFIAYQNRGWAQYIKSTRDIDDGMAQFYAKIRDPLFLNLRYRINNLDEGQIFPQSLPDFYRGAEFTLYGRYQQEDQFSMQLLGDVDGKTKELIFTRSLADAEKGDEGIKRGWAFNAVYHLISEYTKNPDPRVLAKIQELSRRYNVTTPYSPELERKNS